MESNSTGPPQLQPQKGSYIDQQNSLLYYIEKGDLYVKSLDSKELSTTKINVSLEVNQNSHIINQSVPRFVQNPSSELMVSPNGFYLINGSDKQQTSLANVSYSKGIHFWEFYCPLSLYGIQLGVGRKQGSKLQTSLFSFTASTHRSVYFKLDLNQNKIFAWVNKQKQHVLELQTDSDINQWSPCVSLKGKGNVVIFNPFSTDPSNNVSIYNPFNTIVEPSQAPSIQVTNLKNQYKDQNLSLLGIDKNKFLIYNNFAFKIITRNTENNQFQFDGFKTPLNGDSLIQITFTSEQLTILNQYLKKNSIQELSSHRDISKKLSGISTGLKSWFQYFKYLIIHFDTTKSTANLYKIILSKFQRIRPFVHLIGQNVQPLLYSQFNKLAQWKQQNSQNHFKYPLYEFTISSSLFTNNLSPTPFTITNSQIKLFQNHLLLQNDEQISIYNIEITPILVFKSNIETLIESNDIQSNLINKDEQGLQIYKLLNKHIDTIIKPKTSKNIEPNQRMLKNLVEVFKYQQNVAKNALIQVNNTCVDDAVAFIQLSKLQHLQIQRKKSQHHEEVEMKSIPLLSAIYTKHSLFSIVLSLQIKKQIRVFWLGINESELQKLYFKEQKGLVSFISFQYLTELQQLLRDDIVLKNPLFGQVNNPNYLVPKKVFNLPLEKTISNQTLLLHNEKIVLSVSENSQTTNYSLDLNATNTVITQQNLIKQPLIINQAQNIQRSIELLFQQSGFHIAKSEPEVLEAKPENQSYIPLLVQQGPPGCNMNYPICSILYPLNNFLHCYPYTLVFKHLHDKYMKISTVVIERIGKRKGVEVKEGLVWLSNSENDNRPAEDQSYRFKFDTNQKRIALRIDETEFKKYLFIMPIYESTKNTNLPFEIGFVGVTGQQAEESTFFTNTQQLIKSGQITKFIKITQNGKLITSLPQTAIKQDRYVTITLPQTNLESIQTQKPWVLINRKQSTSNQVIIQSKTIQVIISDICEDKQKISNSHLKSITQFHLQRLNQQQTIKFLIKLQQLNTLNQKKKDITDKLVSGQYSSQIKQYFSELFGNAGNKAISNINILNFIIQYKLFNQTSVQTIVNKTLSSINQLSNKSYKELRQSGITHLLFEQHFYSDFYYNLIEGQNTKISSLYNSKALTTNFAVINEKFLKYIIIDLKQLSFVDYLLLCFEKSDIKTKMRIRVYDQNKNLLVGNFYQDSTWIQLTKNPFTKEMKQLFSNPINSGLNCLGLKLNTKTRYLRVQISYTVLPTIGQLSQIQNIPKNQIIPQVFGCIESEANQIPELSKYFNQDPQKIFKTTNVDINKINQYSKFSVSNDKFDYHIYKNVSNVWEQDNAEQIKSNYQKQLQKKDFIVCTSLLKQLVIKSQDSQLGLDYYYTLLIKLLNLKPSLNKDIKLKLFNDIALRQKGPIQVEVIRYLLEDSQYYNKSLYLLDKHIVKLFFKQELNQKEIRAYIKNHLSSLTKQNSQIQNVSLLIQILLNNKDVKLEDWLQQIIILSQKSHQHKLCFKLLEKSNWSQRSYVKKYLEFVANQEHQLYEQLVQQLKIDDLVKFVIQQVKNGHEYLAFQTIKILESNLSKLQNQQLVNELFVTIKNNLSRSTTTFEQTFGIIDKLVQNPLLQGGISAIELLVSASPEIQTTFGHTIQKIFQKQPQKVQTLLFNSILNSNLRLCELNKFYISILTNKDIVVQESVIERFIQLIGEYLFNECNYGGLQGVQCSTELQLEKLIWVNKNLSLISSKSQTNLNKITNIKSLHNLISWILLNNSNELRQSQQVSRTIGSSYILKIQQSITFILESISNLRVQILKKIINLIGKFNQQIKDGKHLLQSTRHIIAYRLHKGSLNLLQHLVKNNTQQYADAFDEEQLNSIIDVMKNQQTQSKRQIEIVTQQDLVDKLSLSNNSQIKAHVKDWRSNTTGNSKSSLFSIPVSCGEFTLTSQTIIYPQKIVIGFLSLYNIDKSNILPKSIDCYAGESQNKLIFIGTLNLVDDPYFISHHTRVFAINLNRLQTKSEQTCIKNIKNKGFKCIKFKINQPALVSLSDVLQIQSKSNTFLNYNVSFLTLDGYQEPKCYPSFSNVYIDMLLVFALENFKQSLKSLLHKKAFKNNLDSFISNLNKWMNVSQYKDSVKALIFAICQQYKQFENSLIDSLLKEAKQNENIPASVTEIIVGAPSRASQRILKFHKFILQLLHGSCSYKLLKSSINSYLTTLELTNLNLQKQNLDPINLPLNEIDMQAILRVYSDLKGSEQNIIIQLLNTLLMLKGKIQTVELTPLFVIDKILNLKHKSDFYSLIAPFASIDKQVTNWFLSNDRLKQLVQQIIQKLDNNSEVLGVIQLISSLSYNKTISDEINRNNNQITIFKSLSDTRDQSTILKNVGKQALGHFVELFKNTCLGTSAQIQFTDILKQTLNDVQTKFSSEYFSYFFFPLLTAFKSVPVVLQPYSGEEKLYITSPNQILNKNPIKLFNDRQKALTKFLNEQVKNRISKIGDFWSIATNASQFPNKAKVLLIESNNQDKVYLIYIQNEHFTVFGDKVYQSTTNQQSIKVDDGIQFKFTTKSDVIVFEHIGFASKPKLEAYNVFPKRNNLLINDLLLSIQNPLITENYYSDSPLKYTTKQPLYLIPTKLTIKQFISQINLAGIKIPKQNIQQFQIRNILDTNAISNQVTFNDLSKSEQIIIKLEYNAEKLFDITSTTKIVTQQQQNINTPQSFNFGLFKSFELQGGVFKFLQVVHQRVSSWKNKQKAQKWLLYLSELKSYSCFNSFFLTYIRNKSHLQLLFNLLQGSSETENEKIWQFKYKNQVKLLYELLQGILSTDNSSKSKDKAVENSFFETILQRLFYISKEPKRHFEEIKQQINAELPELKPKQSQNIDLRPQKKKGVGYGTDYSSNQKWQKQQQEAANKRRSEDVMNIINIIINFIEDKNWTPPKQILEIIYTSALLPTIQAALRAGSLLEISKTSNSFKTHLKFIRTVAKIPTMLPILFDVPKTYVPQQTQSIYTLLKQLEGTNKIFVTMSEVNDQNKENIQLAQDIIQTFASINKLSSNNEKQDQRILQLPLPQKYRLLLQDLRFDYINMKDKNDIFKHKYESYYKKGATLPSTKMVRLAQQISDASTALPIDHTNSIFIRCDKQRVDFMQALIMGSNGTPYGHGAFLFDIYFEDTYPNNPPKVNLTTTGNGKVRFNPNLYSCGKVCLSLLGTWRGSQNQNWDAKVSTLLQVLISIQSIIMTDDIYFNQPSFQKQQGTVQGDRRNQGYANIVRLANIKYAMIDNLKNPPKGFENVIKRHFYLKKDEILQEVRKWVKFANKRQATYDSLVYDQNSSWCTDFKKSKTRYREQLQQSIAELQIELSKLTPPSSNDLIKANDEQNQIDQSKTNTNKIKQENINYEIDVQYNEKIQSKQLDVEDQKVKDRWSRYIGAMGIDAVSRQSKANILVYGLGASALQVVKNLVLSGCKKLSIIDNKQVQITDLSGNFFLTESDIGKQRIDCVLHKIQQLNFYVKVQKLQMNVEESLKNLKDYQLIIATQLSIHDQVLINTQSHKLSIPFISLDVYGPYARLFNDFGNSFEVLDKNGQDPVQVIIESITNEQKGIVTVLKGLRHPYEDGDIITLSKVQGMTLKSNTNQTINGTTHKIKVINSRQFSIGDTRQYNQYLISGIAKNVKLPVNISFQTFDEVINKTSKQKLPIDQNLMYYDFVKINNTQLIHNSIKSLGKFVEQNNRLPNPWSFSDSDKIVELYKKQDIEEFTQQKQKFVRKFSFTSSGTFPPICAFMGGFVAQQAIKAITKKYMPTNALFYCDFNNVIAQLPQELSEWESTLTTKQYKASNLRSQGLRIVVGDELLSEIQKCKVFMIGSGAIGCELLKNYAMLDLGTNGQIHLTDPDHIEVSNLNRQFLFRQKHLRKPKSATAAMSVIQMNERLQGHIHFRLDRVSQETKDIFSDKFFQDMTIITNALDNVQARRYVDQRCTQNRVPLLESGTLGPKGHVQVIIPGSTETYASKQDPVQDGQIPHCTLKMFPEQTLHCVQWARDKFSYKFSLKPKALQKIIQTKDYNADSSQIQSLRQSLKMINKKPDTFNDCILYAINKFYKYFRNDIKQLIYTYPLDAKTKDGQPFWKLPKRPPTPIQKFDPTDILHCTFVTSIAVMLAKIYNVPYPQDFRKDTKRFELGQEASIFDIQQFVPSAKKAQQISKEVSKQNQNQQQNQIQKEEKDNMNEVQLVERIKSGIQQNQIIISPQQFDKDEDHRGHIDLIYSMANLRSRNYNLDSMDWITTKLKAGKIVPALVTTTTSIAALQTYQLVKYLKKVKVDQMRNAFLNLAVPIIQLSEPGEVQKIKIHETLTTNVWDRWQLNVSPTTTLREIFSQLQNTYKLKTKDLIVGAIPVYMSALLDLESRKAQKQQILSKSIKTIVKQDKGYIDITVTFTLQQGGDLIKNIPKIRLNFQ